MKQSDANVETNKIKINFNPDNGTFNLFSKKFNHIIAKNVYCSVSLDEQIFTTLSKKYSISQFPYSGNLGTGQRTRLTYEYDEMKDSVKFQLDIIQYDIRDIIVFEAILTNIGKENINLNYFSPFATDAENDGGIFISDSPENALSYENGLGSAFEFYLRTVDMEAETDSSMMEFFYSKTDISQNMLLGHIEKSEYLSSVITNDEVDEGITEDGRKGIGELRAAITMPFPKKIDPLDSISTGKWLLMLDVESGFKALESYADIFREHNRIRVWPHEIPHGWNSWCNPADGFREFSYVTDVNEQIILDNLEIAVKYLQPFGLTYWQLDSGYIKNRILMVDEVDKERYPHGMKYMADKFHEKGLKAGIWINPFNIGIESPLYKEHPEWFPDPDPSFPVKDGSWRAIDLSNPEAQNYVRHVFRKVVKEWGYDMLKIDFAYHNMGPKDFFNNSMVSSEIHRLGWKIAREEAGPDVFCFGIGGPIGLHMGDIDGERISLDTIPTWTMKDVPEECFDVPQTGGSVFFNYRTMIRKYYLNYRVWINHLDCLCFRPSITRNETMCLANAMALMGGIFKIGDKLVEMKEEDLAVIQKMLPIHKDYVRPVDLFRKINPEILNLPIRRDFLDWNVVGLFNWGINQNLLTGELEPSESKDIKVDFNELGLAKKEFHVFDFWKEVYLGKFSGEFVSKIEPHNSQVISIHEVLERPQFLSSNRHITQGGVELLDLLWNEETLTLSGNLMGVAGFRHHIHFYIPEKYKMDKVEFKKLVNLEPSLKNQILTLKCTGPSKDMNTPLKFTIQVKNTQ